ncbi:hypothetical protein E2C01_027154 [Portunus trituberculatus]|uniref:Uncharacterized protein n=1 Tax=Portunus trituberculatus TaxID=210409 RepID=A0A5B7EHE7_PORTR|nr:hypothetical protein [Portunus trituberculatus]
MRVQIHQCSNCLYTQGSHQMIGNDQPTVSVTKLVIRHSNNWNYNGGLLLHLYGQDPTQQVVIIITFMNRVRKG